MKLLVIDDEEMIRTLAHKILNRAGYEVVLAEDGATGVQTFSDQRKDIKLILLDLIMDGQSGIETLRQIRDMAPSVPCVISSGHTEDSEGLPDDLADGVKFLQKPYRASQLVDMVNDMLSV